MLASVMACNSHFPLAVKDFQKLWKHFIFFFFSKKKRFSFKLPILFLHLKKKKMSLFYIFFFVNYSFLPLCLQILSVSNCKLFFFYYYLHDLFLVYELDHWLEKSWPLARVPKIFCSSIHATCMWFYSFILFNNFFFLWRK